MEPEPIDENAEPGKKPAPFGKRRPSHGAIFGAAETPPQKGKVRQLYPPSPFAESDEAPVVESAPEVFEFEAVEIDGNGKDSLFVSSEHELEERRRRARERAEARRLDEQPLETGPNPTFHQGLDDHEE